MITIKPGSHIHTILTILTLVGEFPMASLGLLGSVRSYGDLIRKLTTVQEFRFPDSQERIQCRLLTVSGKGKRKALRFFRGGLPLVERWDEERFRQYLREYRDHSFSGNSSHIERNHLIAEAAVMCMGAGIQADPLAIPPVMEPQIRKLQPEQVSFYFARDLKRVNEYELNKIRFTRLAGAIVYPGGMYPVYNIRSQMPRWMGDGELKIRLHLHSIFTPMLNYAYPLREAAVMMGSGYEAALSLLKELKETKGLSLGLFEIYRDIFFVPMDGFGSQLRRVLTTQNWRERILRALFKREERSFDMGSFTYDARVDGVYTLSFLDSNLWRLFRFREAVLGDPSLKCRIICFPEQVPFLKSYLGDNVSYATANMAKVEKVLGIQAVNYLGG